LFVFCLIILDDNRSKSNSKASNSSTSNSQEGKTEEANKSNNSPKAESSPSTSEASNDGNVSPNTNSSALGWSNYFSKAVSSYLIPTQVSDVLAQDRAFATAVLAQPGLKHTCGLAFIQKELKLLIACEDGFLYMHDFNAENGGSCKLIRVHDLRYALEGVIGKYMSLSEIYNPNSLALFREPEQMTIKFLYMTNLTKSFSV